MSTAPMPPLSLEPTAQAEVLELEVLASVLLAALELELGPGALPRRSPVVAVVVVCRLLVAARHKEASTARGRRPRVPAVAEDNFASNASNDGDDVEILPNAPRVFFLAVPLHSCNVDICVVSAPS